MDLDDLPREDEIAASQRSSSNSFLMALFMVIAVLGLVVGAIGLKIAADAGATTALLEERLLTLEEELADISLVSGELDESKMLLTELELRVQQSERLTQSVAQQTRTAFDKVTNDIMQNRQTITANNQNIAKLVQAVGGSVRRGGDTASSNSNNVSNEMETRSSPPQAEAGTGASTGSVIEHEIAQGDILSKLAERYNVKLSAILEINPGIVPEKLKIGQIVKIPQ